MSSHMQMQILVLLLQSLMSDNTLIHMKNSQQLSTHQLNPNSAKRSVQIKLHVHVAFYVVAHWACQCMTSHKNLYVCCRRLKICIAFVEFVCFWFVLQK